MSNDFYHGFELRPVVKLKTHHYIMRGNELREVFFKEEVSGCLRPETP
jgi:hypothetical protein